MPVSGRRSRHSQDASLDEASRFTGPAMSVLVGSGKVHRPVRVLSVLRRGRPTVVRRADVQQRGLVTLAHVIDLQGGVGDAVAGGEPVA
jgi:hypothetical protein